MDSFPHSLKPYSVGFTRLLDRLSRSAEECPSLDELCTAAGENLDLPAVMAYLSLLRAFNALDFITQDGVERVKPASETAMYFMRSLAQYIRLDMPLVGAWEKGHALVNADPAEILDWGSKFIYLLEKRRVEDLGDITTMRTEIIAKVLIKVRLRGFDQPYFLAQYDRLAGQYQLIGGKKEPDDPDLAYTAQREVIEELNLNRLVYPGDFSLVELTPKLAVSQHSSSFGVYSTYLEFIFQAIFPGDYLVLGEDDIWVSLEELRLGRTHHGIKIGDDYIQNLEERLPGGLEGLPNSLEKEQYRLRRLEVSDELFLWEMLYQAIYVPESSSPPQREILDEPDIRIYVEGWGREGDMGFTALDGEKNIGAAWLRTMHGYGYVDERIPELSIAILPEYRLQGLGTWMLLELLELARGHYPAISLSVVATSRAVRLYERLGFVVVKENGNGLTMLKRLAV